MLDMPRFIRFELDADAFVQPDLYIVLGHENTASASTTPPFLRRSDYRRPIVIGQWVIEDAWKEDWLLDYPPERSRVGSAVTTTVTLT
jgi:hypothetical protein